MRIDVVGIFKVGDPMPDGYIDRAEWAKVHMKAGLKQEQCCHCCLWHWPHELSERRIVTTAERRDRHGWRKVLIENRICKECEAKIKPKA